jgi:hypothetical protein
MYDPTLPAMSPGIQQGLPGGLPPVPSAPGNLPQGGNPMVDTAMNALDGLLPKSNANPTESMAKVDEALDLAHQLVLRSLPQVTTWNPKLAGTLHQVARQLLSAKVELQKSQDQFAPPPMMGMTMGAEGLPPGVPSGGFGAG